MKQQSGVLDFLQQHPEQFLSLDIGDRYSDRITQLTAVSNEAGAVQNCSEANRLCHDLFHLEIYHIKQFQEQIGFVRRIHPAMGSKM